MAAGTITTTTAAGFNPQIWSLDVVEDYLNNTVFEPLVDRSFQELARAGHGDTIEVPTITSANMGMQNITQGSDLVMAVQETSTTPTAIVVQTYKGLMLQFNDIVLVQSMPSLRKNYTNLLGKQMAITIDSAVAALVASVSQTVGTDNVDLTDDNLLRSEQYLYDANCPDDDWSLVVSPAQMQAFRKVDKYVNSLYKGAVGVLVGSKGKGYVGPLYNCGVYQSTNLTAGVAGHENVMFQKKWVALVIQKGPVLESWRNVTKACDEVTIRAIYGVKQMRATSAVRAKGL